MAEYVERRRVSNACYEIYEETVRAGKDMTAAEVKQLLLRFEKAINATPAADVSPVVHGRWVKPTKIGHRAFDIPHCSACDGVPCGVDENTKYCPNCGARMDKEG